MGFQEVGRDQRQRVTDREGEGKREGGGERGKEGGRNNKTWNHTEWNHIEYIYIYVYISGKEVESGM